MGITGAEYAPCAGEILAALEAVRPPLEELLRGGAGSRAAGRDAVRELRGRMRAAGFEADFLSMRPGREVERWPDGRVRMFNRAVFDAAVQYGAVLQVPNEDSFAQGVEAHERAEQSYRTIR